MFSRILRDLAKPAIIAVIDCIKRSQGLSVGELSAALGLSYMGVKQYCLDLHKRGYLDTWRRPQANGRPELAYRLTAKAQALFPRQADALSLDLMEAVHQLHGATAAEKLLYHYFNKKTEAYARQIKASGPLEFLEAFAKLRDAEGHYAQLAYTPEEGVHLIEYHQPLALLAARYPVVLKLEEAMLARLLSSPIVRETLTASGLTTTVFRLPGLASLTPSAPLPVVKPKSVLKRRAPRRKAQEPAVASEAVATPEPLTAVEPESTPATPEEVSVPEETPVEVFSAAPPEPEETIAAAKRAALDRQVAVEPEPPASPRLPDRSAPPASPPVAPKLPPSRVHGVEQPVMEELLLNL